MPDIIKKHKILEKLYAHQKTIPSHYKGGSFGMDIEMLNKAMDFEVTKDLLRSMRLGGYIESLEHGFHKRTYFDCLTDFGERAYLDKLLLNQLWYRKWESWLSLTATLISLVALFRS